MAYRLPSLNALKAFEAAARNRSFARAAEELNVSQGAVSRHVAILEDALGLRLFVRRARSVEPVPEAEAYLAVLSDAFAQIDGATRRLTRSEDDEPVRVMALPTFATRWLVPRLHRFNQKHPKATISLNTGMARVDLAAADIDVAIEAYPATGPGVISDRLLDIDMVPVCHPGAVGGLPPPSDPAALGRYTLLHTLVRPDLWNAWADSIGIARPAGVSSYFATSNLVMQAAKDGLGVGMVARSFAAQEVADGSLIEPFGDEAVFATAYFLNLPRANLRRPRVIAFRNWLLEEARAGGPPDRI